MKLKRVIMEGGSFVDKSKAIEGIARQAGLDYMRDEVYVGNPTEGKIKPAFLRKLLGQIEGNHEIYVDKKESIQDSLVEILNVDINELNPEPAPEGEEYFPLINKKIDELEKAQSQGSRVPPSTSPVSSTYTGKTEWGREREGETERLSDIDDLLRGVVDSSVGSLETRLKTYIESHPHTKAITDNLELGSMEKDIKDLYGIVRDKFFEFARGKKSDNIKKIYEEAQKEEIQAVKDYEIIKSIYQTDYYEELTSDKHRDLVAKNFIQKSLDLLKKLATNLKLKKQLLI